VLHRLASGPLSLPNSPVRPVAERRRTVFGMTGLCYPRGLFTHRVGNDRHPSDGTLSTAARGDGRDPENTDAGTTAAPATSEAEALTRR
jgi:hypothetical protein